MYQLKYIDPDDVESRPDDYNSAFHRASQHPDIAREINEPYDSNATDFGIWLDVIIESQGINLDDIMIMEFDRYTVETMMDCAKIYQMTGRLNMETVDDIISASQCDKGWKHPHGYFIRCDEVITIRSYHITSIK